MEQKNPRPTNMFVVVALLMLMLVPTVAVAWEPPVTPYRVQYHYFSCELTCFELGDIVASGSGAAVHSIGNGRVAEVGYRNDPGNIGGYIIVEYPSDEGPLTVIYGHLGKDDRDNRNNDFLDKLHNPSP